MPDVIVPMDGDLPSRRNSTPSSRYAEGIVIAFLESGAASAEVKWRETPYSALELYEHLRRACRKSEYRRRVAAAKCGQSVWLRRGGR